MRVNFHTACRIGGMCSIVSYSHSNLIDVHRDASRPLPGVTPRSQVSSKFIAKFLRTLHYKEPLCWCFCRRYSRNTALLLLQFWSNNFTSSAWSLLSQKLLRFTAKGHPSYLPTNIYVQNGSFIMSPTKEQKWTEQMT